MRCNFVKAGLRYYSVSSEFLLFLGEEVANGYRQKSIKTLTASFLRKKWGVLGLSTLLVVASQSVNTKRHEGGDLPDHLFGTV